MVVGLCVCLGLVGRWVVMVGRSVVLTGSPWHHNPDLIHPSTHLITPQCGCDASMSGGLARQERRHSRTMGPIRFSDSSLLRPC